MTHKIADTLEDAHKIEDTHEGKPHGWLQWKGTDVCMDLHCACGQHSHIDAEFTYSVKCPHCNRSYACNGHIELIELRTEPKHVVVADKGEW